MNSHEIVSEETDSSAGKVWSEFGSVPNTVRILIRFGFDPKFGLGPKPFGSVMHRAALVFSSFQFLIEGFKSRG